MFIFQEIIRKEHKLLFVCCLSCLMLAVLSLLLCCLLLQKHLGWGVCAVHRV